MLRLNVEGVKVVLVAKFGDPGSNGLEAISMAQNVTTVMCATHGSGVNNDKHFLWRVITAIL